MQFLSNFNKYCSQFLAHLFRNKNVLITVRSRDSCCFHILNYLAIFKLIKKKKNELLAFSMFKRFFGLPGFSKLSLKYRCLCNNSKFKLLDRLTKMGVL